MSTTAPRAVRALTPPEGDAGRRATALALAGTLVAVAAVWGGWLNRLGRPIHLPAAPLYGRWELVVGPPTLLAVAIAVLVVLWWVPATDRLRWPALLAGSWCASLAWAVALALGDGPRRLWGPLTRSTEYLGLARRVRDPWEFLASFADRLPEYPTHVKGHPPGPVLGYWLLDRARLDDRSVAAVVLVVAAAAAPAVLVALDRLGDRATARRAAAFVGLGPAAVWTATTTDAAVAGIAAWSVALAAVAVAARGRRTDVAAAGAGLLAGTVAAANYGAPALLGPLLAVLAWALARRRVRVVALAAVGAAVVPLALAAGGFDWWDGFLATRRAYLDGVSPDRPHSYFLVANLAALCLAVGPAGVAGLAGITRRRVWLPTLGALAGVAVADLSGMSKGEVERIWLPLVPFLVATAATLPHRGRRRWVAVQLAAGGLLQAALRTPW